VPTPDVTHELDRDAGKTHALPQREKGGGRMHRRVMIAHAGPSKIVITVSLAEVGLLTSDDGAKPGQLAQPQERYACTNV
jgi:hypothetical protein